MPSFSYNHNNKVTCAIRSSIENVELVVFVPDAPKGDKQLNNAATMQAHIDAFRDSLEALHLLANLWKFTNIVTLTLCIANGVGWLLEPSNGEPPAEEKWWREFRERAVPIFRLLNGKVGAKRFEVVVEEWNSAMCGTEGHYNVLCRRTVCGKTERLFEELVMEMLPPDAGSVKGSAPARIGSRG